MSISKGQFKLNLALGAVLSAVFFIGLNYIDCEPIWDGGMMYYEFLGAVKKDFSLWNFNIGKHPSWAYFFLLSIPLYIDYGNIVLLNLMNLGLFLTSILAFYGILCQIFKGKHLKMELSIVTAIYAFSPPFLANAFHLTSDYGVLIFFVFFLYSMLTKNKFLSVLTGTILVFTKETGAAIYACSALLYLIIFIIINEAFFKKRLELFWHLLTLSTPGILYGCYIYYALNISGGKLVFVGLKHYKFNLKDIIFKLDIQDPLLLSYLADIFVLNFTWLLWGIIIFHLLKRFVMFIFKNDKIRIYQSSKNENRPIWFFALLLLGCIYIVTRVLVFNNIRYLFIVFPPLIIIFYYCSLSVIINEKLRKIVLVSIMVLSLVSMFRSIDPVSKNVFGAFQFGRHDIYTMEGLKGWNDIRDQMVYNMQYLNLFYLQNKVFADIKPNRKTKILASIGSNFYCPGRIDSSTYACTWNPNGSFILRYVDNLRWFRSLKVKPSKFYYLSFPNLNDAGYLDVVMREYNVINKKVYDHKGYQLILYSFGPKE